MATLKQMPNRRHRKANTAAIKEKGKFRVSLSKLTSNLSRIGKSLLFPIAVLPIAAIMLRIGAQMPTHTDFALTVQKIIIGAGSIVFDNLAIIFAVGVAFGLTKDRRGEAALAGFIGMLLLTYLMRSSGADLVGKIYQDVQLGLDVSATDAFSGPGFLPVFGRSYDSILSNNVLNGIIAGGLVAYLYNKFNGAELPSVLGFFSGRRLIPVLAILVIMVFGILYAVVFPWIGYLLQLVSQGLADATGDRFANAGIQFVYGFFNRLLIPLGLHHIPNTIFWFVLGSHQSAANPAELVNGDIFIFLNGAAAGNTSGTFQSGFFSTMMFGLPALVGAIWITADNKEQRKRVLALLGSGALISFLSGITEPIEFAFLFVAPTLFIGHALLTGFFGFITGLFGIQIGFGFSAGLLDYMLSIPKSLDIIAANKTGADAVFANPGWIWLIGLLNGLTYFFGAKWAIKRFNFQTPGRGKNRILAADDTDKKIDSGRKTTRRALAYIKALGGYENVTNFDNCATRLRYDVVDSGKVDEKALKLAGAQGLIKVSKNHVQVIVGPTVEILNNEIIKGR